MLRLFQMCGLTPKVPGFAPCEPVCNFLSELRWGEMMASAIIVKGKAKRQPIREGPQNVGETEYLLCCTQKLLNVGSWQDRWPCIQK